MIEGKKGGFKGHIDKFAKSGVPVPLSKATNIPLLPSQVERVKLSLAGATLLQEEPRIPATGGIYCYLVMEIRCGKCHEFKTPENFNHASNSFTGLSYECRKCASSKSRKEHNKVENNGQVRVESVSEMMSLIRQLQDEIRELKSDRKSEG